MFGVLDLMVRVWDLGFFGLGLGLTAHNVLAWIYVQKEILIGQCRGRAGGF